MANQLTSFCPPRNLVGLVCAALTALFSASPAHATLFDRGGGLIYDDVLDVTWTQDADLFGTGSAARGWDEAVSLVSGLSFGGFNDWRLPNTPGTGIGFLNEGELGHLYYTTLGNVAGGASLNTGPFFDIQRGRYWLGTESSIDSAFAFYIAEDAPLSGLQDTDQNLREQHLARSVGRCLGRPRARHVATLGPWLSGAGVC